MERCCSPVWILYVITIVCILKRTYAEPEVCPQTEPSRLPVQGNSFNSKGRLYSFSLQSKSGEVFVGGVDSISKLSSNLTLLQTYTYPDTTGSLFNLLLIDEEHNVLVACGTKRQGICFRHDLNDISTNVVALDGTDKASGHIVSSSGSSVGLVASDRKLHSGFNGSVFYFAKTLDADVPYSAQQSVSTKIWNSEMDGFKLASNYSTNHTGKYSEMSVSKQFANSYKIDYFYTFMHKGFVYFVTKQPKKLGSSTPEVRLVRVCSLDVGYYSYMELTLSCKSKIVKGPSREPIDAYFATVSTDFTARNKLSNDSNDILFLLCGRDSAGGIKMVCPFPMNDVEAAFRKAKLDCQHEISYRPGLEFMFNDEPRMCIPTYSDEVDTCPAAPSNLDNIHVEKNLSSKNILLDAHGDDLEIDDLTSIVVNNYKGHTILVGGTTSGYVDVFNIGAFSKLGTPRKRVKLAGRPIGKQLEVVNINIFALTDRSVHALPLSHFCHTMASCRECVLTSYLQCGYCVGHGCMVQSECRTLSGSWSRKVCPSTVSAVFPKTRSGPLNGGTEITICGAALGHTTPDPSKPSVRELSLGDYAKCVVDGSEDYNKMSCKVKVSNVTNQDRVRVPMTLRIKAPLPTLGYEFEQYEIDKTLNLGSFDFYRVRVNDFSPKKGSEAGGTVLTIYGHHLDVGSSVTVTVGTAPCAVFSRNASSISCVTSGRNSTTFKRAVKKDFPDTLADVKSVAKPSTVKVVIDNAEEVAPDLFSYMPAPSLGLQENAVFRSIYSGGIHILVMGANLESVANPYVTIEFKKLNTVQNVTCTVVKGPSGSLRYLQFLTPALRSNRSIEHGTVTFHLDGLTRKSGIIALPDPEFTGVATEESNGKILVLIKGNDVERICQTYTATFKKCDYTVYIGELLCPDLTPTKNALACTVQRSVLEKQSDSKKRNVTVKVGVNLTITAGQIDLSTTNVAMIGAIVGVVIVICIVVVVVVLKRSKKKRPSASDPVHYDAHASTIHAGNPYHGSSIRNENGHHSELSPLLSGASLRERLSPEILDEMSPLLINPDQVRYDRDDIIGKGNFGIVFHGVYCPPVGTGESQDVKVAIKTMSRIEDLHTVEQFLQEALIMKDFRDEHVLTLIGVLMDENSCPMVVLPFMKHGDLLMFIRNPENKPTVKDLVGFGLQACRGMKYLASNRFVHRDLAARNCMLDEDYTVKVADFGLARDIYEKEYYKPHDRVGRMPVKWMALESLQQQKFTTKTDVWSFGILMWELVTRGVTPYPDVDAFDVLEYLLDGRRLKQPEFCPDDLYQVILRCWNPLPEDRPTFAELVTLVADIHKNTHGVHYPGLNVTYVNLDMHPYPSQIRSSESRSTGASDVFTPGTQTTFVRSPTGPTPPPRNPIPSHDGVFSPEVPLLPRSADDLPEDEQGYLLPSVSGTPKPTKVTSSRDEGAERQHVMRLSENNGEIPNAASPASNAVAGSQQRGGERPLPASAVNPSLRKQDSFVVPPSPLQAKKSPKIRPPVAPKPKYINEGMGSHRPMPVSPEMKYQNISRDSPEFLSNPTYMDREELLKDDESASQPSRNRNNGNNRKEPEERYISNPRLSAALESGYVELAKDRAQNETEEV